MVIRLSARFISIVLLALLAILAMSLVLRATPGGLTLSDDSIAYVAGARSMLAGHGYREAWLASNGPVTHFPPAYPATLAFLGWFGLDPLRGARLLAALLFGLSSALLAVLGWRMTRWLPAGLMLQALFVANSSLLHLHVSALSEPLFIFLSLLAFWTFDLYHERDAHWLWMIACGSIVGMAYLTRYAGLALAATIVLALLAVPHGRSRRWVALSTFAASLLPWVAGWAMRNAWVGGTATNRILVWHPISQSDLDTGLRTFSAFLMPVEVWRQAISRVPGLVPGILTLIFVTVAIWMVSRIRTLRASENPSREPILSWLTAVYVFGYLASILAAMFLFDASTKFKLRILAPLFVSLLILLVALGSWMWTRRRPLVSILALAIMVLSGYGQVNALGALVRGPQGYASFRWYDSQAMEFLRALPAEVMIYTNEPGAVYLYTGRPAYVLPDRVDPVTAADRPGFESGLESLQLDVRSGKAVLALFSGGDTPTEDAEALSAGLHLVHKSGGAEVFGAVP